MHGDTLTVVIGIGIPLLLFVIGSAGSGIIAVIRLTTSLAKSQKAQEQTAKSNDEILDTLKHYIAKTDDTLFNHGERIAVLEYAIEGKSRPKPRSSET